MENSTQLFRTSHVGLAGYLLSTGAILSRVDRSNPRRIMFSFSDIKPGTIASWEAGTAAGNIVTFYNAVQSIKARISGREENNGYNRS